MDASTAPQVIAHSVIPQCSSASVQSPPNVSQKSFSVYCCHDGKTLLSDPSPSPDQSPDILDDVVDNSGLCLLTATASQAVAELFWFQDISWSPFRSLLTFGKPQWWCRWWLVSFDCWAWMEEWYLDDDFKVENRWDDWGSPDFGKERLSLWSLKYILDNFVGSADGNYSTGRFTQWTCSFQHACNCVVTHLLCCSGYHTHQAGIPCSAAFAPFPDSASDGVIHRSNTIMSPVGETAGFHKCKKPGQTQQPSVVKYGVEIPWNVAHAYELDALHASA